MMIITPSPQFARFYDNMYVTSRILHALLNLFNYIAIHFSTTCMLFTKHMEISEAYSESSKTSKIELFAKKKLTVNSFHEKAPYLDIWKGTE